jgi:hypothetical protein
MLTTRFGVVFFDFILIIRHGAVNTLIKIFLKDKRTCIPKLIVINNKQPESDAYRCPAEQGIISYVNFSCCGPTPKYGSNIVPQTLPQKITEEVFFVLYYLYA